MRRDSRLPHRRYSMPETVMRRYRVQPPLGGAAGAAAGADSSDGSEVHRPALHHSLHHQVLAETDSWRSSIMATPSPRAPSSSTAVTSDCQTVSDKTTSTQDSTLSLPSTNSELYLRREDLGKASVSGLKKRGCNILEFAVNVEAELSDDNVQITRRSISTQADEMKNKSTGTQEVITDRIETKESSSQVSKKDILHEMDVLTYRKIQAEVACAGVNYEDFPLREHQVVPRYSAYPRTNSMLVNVSSSVEMSDSEQSLTDSLEDPEESGFRIVPISRPPQPSRHDERPVRGEVTTAHVDDARRRLPKSRDAYAYFLSLSGEEETIRGYVVPDWLRMRLRRREDEIRKIYEDKFSRLQQCAYFRRRKKIVKKIKQHTPYSSSEKHLITNTQTKNERTVHFENNAKNNVNNNVNTGATSDKCTVRVLNGNNMGVEPKIDNIHRINNIRNSLQTNNNNNHSQNEGNPSQHFSGSENNKRDSNLLHISEVIRIDMSSNSGTVITKEKQINVQGEGNVKQQEHINKELSNRTHIVSNQHIDNVGTKTELTESDVLNSSRGNENLSEVTSNPSTSKSFKETSKALIKESENNSATISLDRKIANILISALEENTKAHQNCVRKSATSNKTETTIESFSKISVSREDVKEEPREISVQIQTDEPSDDGSDRSDNKHLEDKGCLTEPYLVSIRIQTSDGLGEYQEDLDTLSQEYSQDNNELPEENEQTKDNTEISSNQNKIDKGCNTFEFVSKMTQTIESILQSGSLLNGSTHKISTGRKKKDVQFPRQVIKQIITGTGEYKTVEETNLTKRTKMSGVKQRGKTSKGTNTDQLSMEEHCSLSDNIEIMNRTHPTPFCKNKFPNKSQQGKTQVLQLNVPSCSCHMCTLQKISPRSERTKVQIQSKKHMEVPYGMAVSKSASSRRSKFQTFDVIPEERLSQQSDNTQDEEREVQTETPQRNTSVATSTESWRESRRKEDSVQTERTMDADVQTERTMEVDVQTERTMEVDVQTERTMEGTSQTEDRFPSDLEDAFRKERTSEAVVQTDRTMEANVQTERTTEAVVQTESTMEGTSQTEQVRTVRSEREGAVKKERSMEAVVQTEHAMEGTSQTNEKRTTKSERENAIRKKRSAEAGAKTERTVEGTSQTEGVPKVRSEREGAFRKDRSKEAVVQTERQMEGTSQTEDVRKVRSQKEGAVRKEAIVQTERTMEADVQTERTMEGTSQTEDRRIVNKMEDTVVRKQRTEAEEDKRTEVRRHRSRLVLGRYREDKGGRKSTSCSDGHEELITLSRGWINFYLLKDNLDFSDTNEDSSSDGSRQKKKTRRTEKVKEVRVEIQATPELDVVTGGGRLPQLTGDRLRTEPGAGGGLLGERWTSTDQVPSGLPKVPRRGHRHQHRTTRGVEVACSEQSLSSVSSGLLLSEDEGRADIRSGTARHHKQLTHINNESSWTVTVGGRGNNLGGCGPVSDLEMKLSFVKQQQQQQLKSRQPTDSCPTTNRQGELSETRRNEKISAHCIQDLSHNFKIPYERHRGGTGKDNYPYDDDYMNRLSSRRSAGGGTSCPESSELGDLQVTGCAISPEPKPRVPTQSERDILRPQRYRFTR